MAWHAPPVTTCNINVYTRLKNLFSLHPFFIKLCSWEYWPMHIIYIPIYAYWLVLSFRARAFIFFSAANPGIELGGFFGESKIQILRKIPEQWLPKTLFVPRETPRSQIVTSLQHKCIGFPIIAKPNVGERGFIVEKINDQDGLEQYLTQYPVDTILQEYIDYPEEVSVLYYRYPGEERGSISSFTVKKYLSVIGDGRSTIMELVEKNPRARLQSKYLHTLKKDFLNQVPLIEEEVILVPIGNHARGATFYNGEKHIDDKLIDTFDKISRRLDGIYFGRFDIKCKSIEDLRAGTNFTILEINGVKSEPTHIYQPGFSLMEAYRILFRHWRTIYEISMANHKRGVPFEPLAPVLKKLVAFNKYKRFEAPFPY